MNLLTLENIVKSYGEKILLNNINLNITEGEKIGVIGLNGTGKSTLLKIASGLENYESGNITKANKLALSYLSQNTNYDDNSTVIEQIFKGDSLIMRTLRDYETTLTAVEKTPQDVSLQKKFTDLTSKIDGLNAWNMESDAKIILTKLGINDFEAKMGTLSGGQKKRVSLASALITPADLLLLDEPTNHIDNETTVWLEQYLNTRKGSLLMITHDRYFLDRVTNRIIELDRGSLYSYSGNYSTFLEKKIEREEIEKAQESKRENILRKELAWIQRGAKARTTKQKARIQRFEELQDQGANSQLVDNKVEISSANSRLGKKVIELNNICKSYEHKKIIDDFNYIFSKGDKVGIIGPNGIGKSTLLHICTGIITPDSGEVIIGGTVKIGYFSQESKEMNENLRVIEYVKEGGEFIENEDGQLISASKMLERFLFTSEMQWTPISKISGGERRRLYLLRVLMESPNVLILDEPTNDLDIQTLTVLEDYIESFNGTVIAVSHDRYFLDKISEKLLIFKDNNLINHHVGNYSEYIERHGEEIKENEVSKNSDTIKEKDDRKKNRALKFSYKEQKEYDEIESVIENTENEIVDLDNKISFAGSNYVLLQELLENKKSTEEKLQSLYERWEYLNELANKINSQKSC